jgi:hypothetical protein
VKIEGLLFGAIGAFFMIVIPIYWFMSGEIIGTVALILSMLLSVMVAAYFLVVGRKMDARYEDRKDAEIVEGAGSLGFFPPKSIWPFWLALTVTIFALGPVFGWWISLLAAGLGIWALTGWVYEFYRGDYQH